MQKLRFAQKRSPMLWISSFLARSTDVPGLELLGSPTGETYAGQGVRTRARAGEVRCTLLPQAYGKAVAGAPGAPSTGMPGRHARHSLP